MAYSLTKADVLLVAGELSAVDDARWAFALETAGLVVGNADAWGGDAKAKKAAVYLAAHLAKLSAVSQDAVAGRLASGPVTEIHAGPVGKSFASMSDFASDKGALQASLALTPYGVTFGALQRLFSFGRFVVT